MLNVVEKIAIWFVDVDIDVISVIKKGDIIRWKCNKLQIYLDICNIDIETCRIFKMW